MLPPTADHDHARPAAFPKHLLQRYLAALLIVCTALVVVALPVAAQQNSNAADVDSEMISREAALVHLVNMEREKVGAPPLRWNRELSEAASWLTRDTVDGSDSACDHNDSLGDGVGSRMRRFGYPNPTAFGELIVCGFVEPEGAVIAWATDDSNNYMQKNMMLDTRFREVGVSFYFNQTKRRGLVVMKLAADDTFAPVVINHEAESTESPDVSLYIYPGAATPVSIKISSNPTFADAAWEPFVTDKVWTLPAGEGWRSVYVLTKDATGATTMASDQIWLGKNAPGNAISLDQASSIGLGYAIDDLPDSDAPLVRFSLGWQIDDAENKIVVYRGTAEAVYDDTAVGGTARKMRSGDRETLARAIFDTIPRGRIFTAYFRLKTDDISSTDTLADLQVIAGDRIFGPVHVRPMDFTAANAWQEFGVEFLLPSDATSSDVEVHFAHYGIQQMWLDTLRVFSQPLSVSERVIWPVEMGTLRSMGVQARFDGPSGLGEPFDIAYTQVDSVAPLDTSVPAIQVNAPELVFESMHNVVNRQDQVVLVCGSWCGNVKWTASADADWLHFVQGQEGLLVYVDPNGLIKGAYQSLIAISPALDDVLAADSHGYASEESPGMQTAVLQTWVDVRLYVDGAQPIPPHQVNSVQWLPLTQR